MGGDSNATEQSRTRSLTEGRGLWVTWGLGIGRERSAHERWCFSNVPTDVETPLIPSTRQDGTTDERTIRRSASRRPASLRDATRSRLNKEKRVCLRGSTLVNPTARDLNKSAISPSRFVPLARKNGCFRQIYRTHRPVCKIAK